MDQLILKSSESLLNFYVQLLRAEYAAILSNQSIKIPGNYMKLYLETFKLMASVKDGKFEMLNSVKKFVDEIFAWSFHMAADSERDTI
ncbi:MAG: hypothetical protein ACKOAD_04435, partial [Gammaproteobacteria bacterium]